MQYGLIGMWSSPTRGTVEEFEMHYTEVDVCSPGAAPHLTQIFMTRTGDRFGDAEPTFYRVAEISFASPEDMANSSQWEQWHAMPEDAGFLSQEFCVTMQAAAGWVDG